MRITQAENNLVLQRRNALARTTLRLHAIAAVKSTSSVIGCLDDPANVQQLARVF